jgi:hypothetical protein
MPETISLPKVFDRALVAQHLARRAPARDDFVTKLVLDDLVDRLADISRPFTEAIILAPDPFVLPETGRSATAEFRFSRAGTVLSGPDMPLVDPEALVLPRRDYDLIVSIFDLDIVDDVPGFLARARAHLKSDGLLLCAAIGGDSLTELREAFLTADDEISGGVFPRVAPFIPLNAAAGLLQRAGFALPVSDVETHVVRYGSPLALMRELKALGASNPLVERPRRPATLSLLRAASAAYEALAGEADGKVRATLDIVWLSGWAPHESQQKPLRPGSATVRLEDVLKPGG